MDISLFLNQVVSNDFVSTFSVYYSLNTKFQSKIIFGPPQLGKYARVGSTPEDVKWANIANTTLHNQDQWLS